MWNAAKGDLREKLIENNAYLMKEEISKINNPTLHLKKLEKEEQTKPKVSRRKGITKIRAEMNEIETKKTITKINGTESWLFEMISKIDKPLVRLIKKRERTQISKIRNEKGEATTDSKEIPRIIRDYCEQLYANNMDNLEEMDKFLERYSLPRLNQEEMANMNRPITSTEIETVIKNLPTNKSPGPDGFTGEFCQKLFQHLLR